jgi:hypothetical protein
VLAMGRGCVGCAGLMGLGDGDHEVMMPTEVEVPQQDRAEVAEQVVLGPRLSLVVHENKRTVGSFVVRKIFSYCVMVIALVALNRLVTFARCCARFCAAA